MKPVIDTLPTFTIEEIRFLRETILHQLEDSYIQKGNKKLTKKGTRKKTKETKISMASEAALEGLDPEMKKMLLDAMGRK